MPAAAPAYTPPMPTPTPIPDWPRPLYEASGRAAELMYVIVGPPPEPPLKISRQRHHVDRVEPQIVVSHHKRAEDPAWFEGWFAPPLGAEIDGLFARPEEIRSAGELTIVHGRFEDPPNLNYLRNTVGIVSAIADTPGTLAIFDVLAVQWWRLGDWRASFVDAPSAFRIGEHIGFVVSDDPDRHPGLWTHTRGMIKFGRPELHIQHVEGGYSTTNPAIRGSGHVLNGIASYLAQGASIRDGQTLLLPETDAYVSFFETDDPATRKHFNNSAIEIVDYDEDTGEPLKGASRLLEKASRRREEQQDD